MRGVGRTLDHVPHQCRVHLGTVLRVGEVLRALSTVFFCSHSFAGGRTCCTDDDGASSVGLSDTVLGLVNAKEQRALQEAEERRFDAEIQTRLRDVTRLEALSPLGPVHGRVTGGAKMVVTGDPAIEFAVSCYVDASCCRHCRVCIALCVSMRCCWGSYCKGTHPRHISLHVEPPSA